MNSSNYLTLQRQALAHVCKRNVLKNFAKFTGKHPYQMLPLQIKRSFPLRISSENVTKSAVTFTGEILMEASFLSSVLYCEGDLDADAFL